jgi:hypothetical protein
VGKASRLKQERAAGTPRVSAAAIRETHEPDFPLPGWPQSHVDVALTDPDEDECIAVTIHGVAHYLHSTTARELNIALQSKLEEWNVIAQKSGFSGV